MKTSLTWVFVTGGFSNGANETIEPLPLPLHREEFQMYHVIDANFKGDTSPCKSMME